MYINIELECTTLYAHKMHDSILINALMGKYRCRNKNKDTKFVKMIRKLHIVRLDCGLALHFLSLTEKNYEMFFLKTPILNVKKRKIMQKTVEARKIIFCLSYFTRNEKILGDSIRVTKAEVVRNKAHVSGASRVCCTSSESSETSACCVYL